MSAEISGGRDDREEPEVAPDADGLANTWVFGDNVNTDVIHPPHFYSLDPDRVKRGLFKGIDDTLQARLCPGDIVIGGRNFGCGSSRETSIRSLMLNKIGAVIAVDFARIFFRNATNHGLPCLTFARPEDKAKFAHGGKARLSVKEWHMESESGERAKLVPVGRFVQDIWRAGGLLNLLEAGHAPRL